LRSENRAPSNPERRSYTAGARPPRTFLPPRFLSTSADKSLRLGGCSARTPVIELHDHSLMQQVRPGLYAKYFFFKFRMDDVNFHGFTLLLPVAQRQFHAWPRERPLKRLSSSLQAGGIQPQFFVLSFVRRPNGRHFFFLPGLDKKKPGCRWTRRGESIRGYRETPGSHRRTTF